MNFSQIILILLARKRVILITLFVTTTIITTITLLLPKTYVGETSLVVNFKGVDPITGIVLPAQLMPGYMATQVDIATSHNVALRAVDRLKLDKVPQVIENFHESMDRGDIRDWLANSLVKNLEVKPSRESSVIAFTYSGTDPQFVAELANTFAWAYIQANIELNVEPARQQSAWFDEQLKDLRNKVEVAQKRLSDYQRETGLLPTSRMDGRLDVENARLAELSSQLVAAQTQTYESITRQRQISGAHAKGKLGELPDILNNALIQNMKAELTRAESKLAEASERVSQNHPHYISALAEVQSLKQKIAAEIQTARGSMENAATQAQQRENELKKALAEQKTRVMQLKEQRDRSDLLTQEMNSAQAALDSTTQRANLIRLESQRNLTDIAVLNPAVAPSKHTKPNIPMNIGISIVLGTMLGFGLALILELLDRRVRSVEDITENLGLPVLVVIAASATAKSRRFFRRKGMPLIQRQGA